MDRKRRRPHFSPKPSKRRRSRSPKPKKIADYSHELTRFLDEQANIRNTHDFWKFHTKYEAIQATKPSNNRSKPLNIDFTTNPIEKVPFLDKNGEKIRIKPTDFDNFLLTICVYKDFEQKQKFAKLKQLRQSQKDLPIYQYKREIIEKLATNRVLLIAGDTGCGKSTQVPQYIHEAGGYDKIVCTQPRRIACVSLAKRVAYETLTDYKSTVGYQIRFERTKRADTSIVFMTEGLLLRQTAEEETLGAYDVIILDEVHERHLHADFLVGIMKCLLHKPNALKNFKLILMSATINLELFQAYFDAEVIRVPGRLYPIALHYRPIIKDPFERTRSKLNCTPYLQIIQLIDETYQPNQKGDLLIFLNGFTEITTLAEAITEYASLRKNWIVLQLHSSLSLDEQDRIFDIAPDATRKCIISTNIAETSVTIDGVRFVIDSGKVNRMMWQHGVNKLSETSISKDSAKQRSGRAGRTGPGICYRLYSEDEFNAFDAYTPAEIHLVPLDSLLLQMVSLGLSNLDKFPFLERPSNKSITESVEKLKFIGALRLNFDQLELSELGQALSQLPVDLAIGKMLILSIVFDHLNAILAVAALLSIQSPLTQAAYRNTQASDLRKCLESNHGDPISLLNYYKEWLSIKQECGRGNNESKMWTKKRCLEEQRFYEATKLVEQFREILTEAGLLSKLDGSLNSRERAIRHGELKQLKKMRYDLKNEQKSKRKKLKFEQNGGDVDDENEEKGDLRDVEFRIVNDFKKLQKLLNESTTDSYKDLILLKLILTSGLYPQIALEDEHNTSKTVSERLYHTKTKNFVFLRPLSFFASNPDFLTLKNDDIEVPPIGYFSKRPISKKHQILLYQTILETKKVYLVNTMRMPAIQTLFLFAKSIGTNNSCTQFVFDDFVLIDAPYFGQGRKLLVDAIELRKKWQQKLEQKLKDPSIEPNRRSIFYFIDDLVRFMNTEVSYNVKRLLPADIKVIYTRNSIELVPKINPFDMEFTPNRNDEIGGVRISENCTFGCLVQEEWAWNLEAEIIANGCNCGCGSLGLSIYDIFVHEMKKPDESNRPDEKTEEKIVIKPNSKPYTCNLCNKQLMLTPVDILKHKKSCNKT